MGIMGAMSSALLVASFFWTGFWVKPLLQSLSHLWWTLLTGLAPPLPHEAVHLTPLIPFTHGAQDCRLRGDSDIALVDTGGRGGGIHSQPRLCPPYRPRCEQDFCPDPLAIFLIRKLFVSSCVLLPETLLEECGNGSLPQDVAAPSVSQPYSHPAQHRVQNSSRGAPNRSDIYSLQE